MPTILSVGKGIPEYAISQDETMEFARNMFSSTVKDIDRLLKVFRNGEIEKRHFVKPLDWYRQDHSFEEKNEAYIEKAVDLSIQAIEDCLRSPELKAVVPYEEVEAIFMVSTTGLSTPSLEARIMNRLPFSSHTKRMPIWGLGCAGGAAGLSRASEYCKAFPKAKVLLVAVELCSLTFQKDDLSKSNIIGTSLFADGAAAVLLAGADSDYRKYSSRSLPSIVGTESTLMENSLDVMGWDIKDQGLYVVFSKDIPSIVENWLEPNVRRFVGQYELDYGDIKHFIAHPGGKKVITAYEKALDLSQGQTDSSLHILKRFGNMSSVTVLFVLREFLEKPIPSGEHGIIAALGPGFSSELLLARWDDA